jgi:nicotinamidase-related amidase
MTIVTRDNACVLFLDLQEEIVKNSRTVGLEKLERTTGALARLAMLHGLPTFLSIVPQAGAFLPSVTEALGEVEQLPRVQTSAFSDAALVAALQATGRSVLILSGVASEIVVQRTALDALAAGFEVLLAVDACGGLDPRTEDAAWRRITGAGGVLTSVVTIAAELAGDFTTPTGGQTIGIMYDAMS